MAWEWVSPVSSAAVAIVGTAATLRAGRGSRDVQMVLADRATAEARYAERKTIYAQYLAIARQVLDRISDLAAPELAKRQAIEELQQELKQRDPEATVPQERVDRVEAQILEVQTPLLTMMASSSLGDALAEFNQLSAEVSLIGDARVIASEKAVRLKVAEGRSEYVFGIPTGTPFTSDRYEPELEACRDAMHKHVRDSQNVG